MITVRDATEDDLPAIIDIYNESIPAGRSTADTEPITIAERLDWFRKFDAKKRPIWVALDQGRIVGCVYLSWFYGGRPAYDKTAEISTYISSSHQGKGIGTMLKQRMIEACPRLGVENLLSMYFDHNEATQRLNDKFGFEGVGHLPEIADVLGEKRGLRISLLRIKKCEQPGPTNPHAFGTSSTSAAEQPLVPEASGNRSSGTLGI
jgi:phosphinothricin acetyltransferase